MVALYRRGLGRIVASWLLLLTTRGRRSGRQYTTPIGYVPDTTTQALYLFRAAAGGADWLANVRALPKVQVQVGQRQFSARATILHDEQERRRALARYLRHLSPPAWAARRAFGLERARTDESIARAALATQPVLVALHLDNTTPSDGA